LLAFRLAFAARNWSRFALATLDAPSQRRRSQLFPQVAEQDSLSLACLQPLRTRLSTGLDQHALKALSQLLDERAGAADDDLLFVTAMTSRSIGRTAWVASCGIGTTVERMIGDVVWDDWQLEENGIGPGERGKRKHFERRNSYSYGATTEPPREPSQSTAAGSKRSPSTTDGFHDYRLLEERFPVKIYFATPYHSWERGSKG